MNFHPSCELCGKKHIMSTHHPNPIAQITAEHSSWLRGISFYRDEIRILKHRLAELSDQQAGAEFKSRISARENDLLDLTEAIEKHVKHLESDFISRESWVTNSSMAEHDVMRDRYVSAEKSMNTLRHEFNSFLISRHPHLPPSA